MQVYPAEDQETKKQASTSRAVHTSDVARVLTSRARTLARTFAATQVAVKIEKDQNTDTVLKNELKARRRAALHPNKRRRRNLRC